MSARQALGRGLDALIPKPQDKEGTVGEVLKIPIEKIRPNHLQPRRHFDPEALSELAQSIKQHGIAQPLLVSFDAVSKTYELIAGERRLRAAEIAGLKEVEAIVRKPQDDRERLVLALIENLQREGLNPIEEALGYLRLMKEFQIPQTQLAQVVGKSKSAVSNTLRLLDLPDDIQKAIQFGKITEGHARAILMVQNQAERHKLFHMILEQSLSVRLAEDMARQINAGEEIKDVVPKIAPAPEQARPADLVALENAFQQILATKVEIRAKKGVDRGSIVIHYYSLNDFDRIVKMIKN
ncbi:MAG: ParB/RepB/Spo0J family partition protein [Elusimicrobia bacterium]|nr:ParB/RepB/Spo0J family partition protein [Elusimicrobiota bacterium]